MRNKYTDTAFSSRSDYTAADVSCVPAFSNNAAMEYGQNIKRFRKAAHLTQDQLAERMEVEQPTVQRWEAQKREPSPPRAGFFMCDRHPHPPDKKQASRAEY